MTMTLVETIEVGSGGATSIEFTSIPQDADDLLLVVSARKSTTGNTLSVRFNNDSGSNYTTMRLTGTGSAVYSSSYSSTFGVLGNLSPSDSTANTFGNVATYIPNYAGSSQKTFSSDSVAENNATAAPAELEAGRWTGTAAITSILVYVSAATLVQYSTASLYKITKA